MTLTLPDNSGREPPRARPPRNARQRANDWFQFGLSALSARRWTVIGVAVCVTLAAALVSVCVPKTYRVECRMVAQSSGALATRGDTTGKNSPTLVAPSVILRRDNLVNLVKQTDLVEHFKAKRNPLQRLKDRLAPPPNDAALIEGLADSLEKRLVVTSDETTVTIQADWPDAVLAYRLADAARQSFLETRHVGEVSTLAESAAILEGHAATLRGQIDASLKKIQGLLAAKSADFSAPRGSATEVVAPAPTPTPTSEGSDADDAKAQSRRAELAVLIDAKQRALDELENARRQRISDLQSRLDEARAQYTEEHPTVIELRQTLKSASRPSPEAARLNGELERLRQENATFGVKAPGSLRAYAVGAPALGDRISDAERFQRALALDADPEVQLARSELNHALESYEKLSGALTHTRIDLDTAQAAFRYRYTTVQPPVLPDAPFSPKIALIVVMGLLAGLLIGVTGAIGLELREGVLTERWQVEGGLALPVLASMPSPAGSAASEPVHVGSSRLVWSTVVALGVLTIASLIVMNGHPVGAIAPLAAFLLVWSITKLPLKIPALAMMFMILTLDNPAEQFAAGAYKSPLFPLAQLLQSQLKNTIPSGVFVFSGIDVLLVLLFGVHFYRRATGSRIDREDPVAVPFPMIAAAWACLLGTLLALGFGLVTGGSFRFSLWQIQRNIYLPLMFLLFQAAFPNPSSCRSIARLLIVATSIKSVLAIFLRDAFPKAEYATSHSDSMLFATVVCMLLIAFFEFRNRKTFWNLLWLLPLFTVGMVMNNRRLVWVNLGFALIFAFFMMPWSRLKIRIARSVLIALPIVTLYCIVGWGSSSRIFGPVATLRSMTDSQSDMSTLWRDLENFNLVSTLQHHPVLGTGWGHPYEEVMHMPDVTRVYELEPYLPHNSIVGLFAYTGYVGFALLWTIVVVGLYFAARAYYFSREPVDRTAALTAFSAFGIYANQAYGDMGLGSWTSVFLIASALTLSGKLAVTTGAWSHRVSKTRREVPVIEVQPSQS